MNNKTTKTEQIDHLKAFIKQESRRVKFFNEQIKKEWEKIIEAKLIRKFGISTNLIYENK